MIDFFPLKSTLKTLFFRNSTRPVPVDRCRPGRMMLALESRFLYDASGVTAGLDVLGALSNPASDPADAAAADGNDAAQDGVIVDEVVPPAAEKPDEVVFIDAGIDDPEKLVGDLPEGVTAITLAADRDGVAQIAEYLAEHDGVATVHILSHGESGAMVLGSTRIAAETIDAVAEGLTAWGRGLTADADILLYGCNVAESATGTALVDRIAALTGADVAASDDATGSADLGGDWDLEISRGTIDTPADYDPAAAAYDGLLAANTAPEIDDASYALHLEGTATDYLIKSSFSGFPTTELTIEMWVRTDDTTNEGSLFSYASTGSPNEALLFNYGNLNPEINAVKAAGEAGSGVAVNDGDWHHVAWTWENGAGTSSLYVDGVLVHTGNISVGHTLVGNGTLVFGQEQDSVGGDFQDSQSFNGDLDEVRVWNVVRSEAEIQAAMDKALTGAEAGLVSYWRMNGGAGATIADSAGANDLTVVGAGATWISSPIETAEDQSVTISTVSIADTDAGAADVQATLAVSDGTITLAQTTGLTSVSGNGSASVTVQGDMDEINAAINGMTYTPDADFSGTDTLSVSVDDLGNTGDDGAKTAAKDITITVTAVNDAPVLDNSGAMTLTAVTEDASAPAGDTVAAILASATGDRITDADAGALEGIALTGTTGDGTWQYNTGGGWTDVGAVAGTSALLLSDAASLRFVPTAGNNNAQSATATFRAWDQSADAQGTKVDASTNGGTSAFSTATETASVSVTAVNDAPVLDNSGAMALTAVTEDAAAPAGDTVAAILASAGGDRITDADTGAVEGIALTGITGDGTWQYNTGGSWTDVGAVAGTSALLLADTASLRFVPTAGNNNAQSATATFRAWDQSSGSEGSKVDASTNGGTSAFSTATETASVSVTAVNDAPVLDNSGAMTLTAVTEDAAAPAGDTVAAILASATGNRITDADTGAAEGIALTGITGDGTWQYNTGGGWTDVGSVAGTSALLLADTASLRFVPTAGNNNAQSATATFRAWDQSSGSEGSKVDASTNGGTTAFSTATETASVSVTAVNDAPVLDNSGAMTLTAVTEDAAAPAGDTVAAILASAGGDKVTDADTGAAEGIALTGITGDGTWQYNTGGGWTDVGSVSGTSALLLADTASLRFVPDADSNDNTMAAGASIAFRAWDRSSGSEGTKVDASTTGGTSAFSTASETAALSVTAVNDDPAWTVPGGQSVLEENDLVFSAAGGNAITVADIDATEAPGELAVTLAVGHGALTLSQTAGLTFTVGDGAADSAMTFTGTAAAVNAALEGMVYRGDTDYNSASGGAETLALTVNDQGNTGSGGGVNVTADVAVDVGAVGDTPTVDSVTTLEDTQSGLIAVHRPASDASAITHFQIANITGGALFLADGVTPVADGAFITVAQGQAGLRFTPDVHSDADGGFDVHSSENGVTVADQSAAPAHSTITVIPVADAPALTVTASASGNQDTAISLEIEAPALIDTDGSESLGDVTVSGVPDGAVLSAGVNHHDGTWTLTSAQLPNLTITPPVLDHRDFTLTVSATATESGNADAATTARTILVDVHRVYNINTVTESPREMAPRPTPGRDDAAAAAAEPGPLSETMGDADQSDLVYTSPETSPDRLAADYGGGATREIVRYEAVAMAREMGSPETFPDTGLYGVPADGSSDPNADFSAANADIPPAPGLTEQIRALAQRFEKDRAHLVERLAAVPRTPSPEPVAGGDAPKGSGG